MIRFGGHHGPDVIVVVEQQRLNRDAVWDVLEERKEEQEQYERTKQFDRRIAEPRRFPPSVPPALRGADEKVAKGVNSRDIFQLLCVDQEAVHLRHVRFRQEAHEAGIGLHAVVG